MSSGRRHNDDYGMLYQFQNLHIKDQPNKRKSSASKRKITPPIPSVIKPSLLNINHSGPKVVTYRNLHPCEPMYATISDLITNVNFVVENIVEVNNPFLLKAYERKRAQKVKEFGEVYESLVFHGTKKANVDSICTHNFNWRFFGSNSGHKYGKGVSFSTNSTYASYYSERNKYHKVMIVAKVLISNVCQGHQNMSYPPPGYDTSQKGDNGIVLVKYEDNEFYPAYKLYYHLEESDEYSDEDFYYDFDSMYYY